MNKDSMIIKNENKKLKNMIDVIKNSDNIYHPSLYWENLNKTNLNQLIELGYSNFKRTVNQNYFNFLIRHPGNPDFRNLLLEWLKKPYIGVFNSKFKGDKHVEFPGRKFELSRIERFVYKLFISMLWNHTKKNDKEKLLLCLEEPIEGNPLRIYYKGKLVSQDLCNSIWEYYSIMNKIPNDEKKNITIAELGGGYGRCAYVFLKALKCKYVIFDIPPALYICEKYLSAVFPKHKIFKFRDFKKYSEIKSEYEKADICFLTPNQMELLPKKQFDIFLTISSLQEMKKNQIENYFHLIDKYTKGYFYIKQWLKWSNPLDNITISFRDYPVPSKWETVFFRKHPIQISFFEAMYKVL